jgi:hypothetical protein
MGGARSTYGRDEEYVNFKGRSYTEDLGVDRYIKMDLKETKLGDLHWIHVVKDRDLWQALVNIVKSLRVPYKDRHFLTC